MPGAGSDAGVRRKEPTGPGRRDRAGGVGQEGSAQARLRMSNRKGAGMKIQKAYCSACDRQVEVVIPDDLPEGTLPSAHDPASCVCLEYGETCTGSLCPLFDVPTDQMEENYKKIVAEIRQKRAAEKRAEEGRTAEEQAAEKKAEEA